MRKEHKKLKLIKMKDKNNIGSKKIRNEVILNKMMEKMMEKSG